MYCKYLSFRTKKYEKYKYCRQKNMKKKIENEQCRYCKYREYKSYKLAKKKTSKLAKLEKKRFSILTNNLNKCYFCHNKKQDFHEVFRGRNRQKSMKWGLIVPICSICHSRITNDKEFSRTLENTAKQAFIEKYGIEKFVDEFK